MTIETILSIIGICITTTGLGLVLYQIRAARRDTLTGSFVSSISEHWQFIEEQRLALRAQVEEVYYPKLNSTLDNKLKSKYHNDLHLMAKDYLFEYPDNPSKKPNKKDIYKAIASEFAYQDIVFNLYEEEYMAGWELNLVNRKLKKYWMYYMQQSFKSKIIKKHWQIRNKIGKTYKPFVDFVNQKLLKV